MPYRSNDHPYPQRLQPSGWSLRTAAQRKRDKAKRGLQTIQGYIFTGKKGRLRLVSPEIRTTPWFLYIPFVSICCLTICAIVWTPCPKILCRGKVISLVTCHIAGRFYIHNLSTARYMARYYDKIITSWWLNQPLFKIYESKWVQLPQFSGWKFQKYLSWHHPDPLLSEEFTCLNLANSLIFVALVVTSFSGKIIPSWNNNIFRGEEQKGSLAVWKLAVHQDPWCTYTLFVAPFLEDPITDYPNYK